MDGNNPSPFDKQPTEVEQPPADSFKESFQTKEKERQSIEDITSKRRDKFFSVLILIVSVIGFVLYVLYDNGQLDNVSRNVTGRFYQILDTGTDIDKATAVAREYVPEHSREGLLFELELVKDLGGWMSFRVIPTNMDVAEVQVILAKKGNSWEVIGYGTSFADLYEIYPEFFDEPQEDEVVDLEDETADVQEELIGFEKPFGDDYPDTSDWKTYRNEEYGFEVGTPNDWVIETLSDDGRVCFMSPDRIKDTEENEKNCSGDGGGHCITEWINCDIYFSNDSSLPYASEATLADENVNGVMFMTFNVLGLYDFLNYETTKNGNTYNFSFAASYMTEEYRPIISTFKFTEPQ